MMELRAKRKINYLELNGGEEPKTKKTTTKKTKKIKTPRVSKNKGEFLNQLDEAKKMDTEVPTVKNVESEKKRINRSINRCTIFLTFRLMQKGNWIIFNGLQ